MLYRSIQYLFPLIFFACAWFAFNSEGLATYSLLLLAFGIIPCIELLMKPDVKNMEAAEASIAKQSKVFDYILYFFVALMVACTLYFLYILKTKELDTACTIGIILTQGLMAGIFGINLGHELGHHTRLLDRRLAKIALSTSLYMHFYVEHNKGHHKHVATPHDPATALFNENIYSYFFRCIPGIYKSAWHIENQDSIKKTGKKISVHNEMFMMHIYQGLILLAILITCGWQIMLYFIIASFIGILLLEGVEYVQHYGLQRKLKESGLYERTTAKHSWDSHYPIGRLILFELSRHSDHHYLASKKYQLLDAHDNAPQMPTGYPGTIILAFVPPLWFKVMNKRLADFQMA
jgi:alkane 1-monooxygenase